MHTFLPTLLLAASASAQGGGGNALGGLISSIAKGVMSSSAGKNGVALGPAPKGCSAFEILVARGTGEPGPFGTIVGDGLVRRVKQLVPGARGYAVQYPANMNMSVSAPTGVDDTIKRLNAQAAACPQQRFALVGYSQGAGVMHGVFGPTGGPIPGIAAPRAKLNAATVIPKIVALAMFGDPGFRVGGGKMGRAIAAFPPALQAKLIENCAAGDPVCDPAGGGFENHLKYVGNPYQSSSASFIAAGFKGQPLPNSIKSAADPRWKGAKPGSAKSSGGFGKAGGAGKMGGGKGFGGAKGAKAGTAKGPPA